MRDLEHFRRINSYEMKILDSSVSKLNLKLHEFLIHKSKNLYILLGNANFQTQYPSLFLISDEICTLINKLNHLENLVAAGLYLGFIKKNEFFLSIEGANFLYDTGLIPKNRILIVNKVGEKSILYGNNITKEMVVEIPEDFQINTLYIITNEQDEILAIAISKISSNNILNLEAKDIIAFNLTDKGKYLRETQ